ncbi:MAG: zinc ribbon domain-containing protein [Thermoplasmatales archaeon]|nr:zinc ribbon domain-containing protein [Thermoplasmatales archaeon]
MVKYCPNCGVEVKEGFKFCLGCGAQLQTDAAAQPAQAPAAPPVQPQQPIPPPVAPQQGYAPMPPQKSNMKLIGAIIAIVVIVVVVALVLVLFMGEGISGSDSRFVGEWEQSNEYMSGITWSFKSGGSFESMGIEVGTWRVNGNQVCITPSHGGSGAEVCYDYTFSPDGNTLTLSFSGVETELTKK